MLLASLIWIKKSGNLLVFTTQRGAVRAMLITPAIEPNSRSFNGECWLLEKAVLRP